MKRGSFLLIVAFLLSACGSGGSGAGGEEAMLAASHTVPVWIGGTWRVTTVELGLILEDQGMTLTIDADHFEYHYPDCDVYGALAMDPFTPSYASNQYVMVMDERTRCSTVIDIATYPGAIDTGRIWSFDDGLTFERVSDNASDSFWVYEKLLL